MKILYSIITILLLLYSSQNAFSQQRIFSLGIVNKKALTLPKPQVGNVIHPRHLKIQKEEIVAVQILIDMDGIVTSTKAISGHPLLYNACELAAQQAKFSPTLINGLPISVKDLLVYKFKPEGIIDTDIEANDKDVIGTPINLVKPAPLSCDCKFGGNSTVLVEAKIDESGNITEAKAVSGHPMLKTVSEKAARESKVLPANVKARVTILYSFVETGKRSVENSDVGVKGIKF